MENPASSPKIGRNDLCPCGSGLKHKRCCLKKNQTESVDLRSRYLRQYNIHLKSTEEIEGIRRAGRLVMDTLDHVEKIIRPGITTDEINTFVHEYTLQHNARPAPLNYKGFPKSVCTSLNEVICHGIPSDRVIQDGDIINVDVTSILDGFYADANKTFLMGNPGPDARKIVSVSKECLRLGIEAVRPGAHIGDIGAAIQKYAESHKCSVVREFVGHGVGLEFHEEPQVPHFGRIGQGISLVPGMVFTVEPMINLGNRHLYIQDDEWTAVTADGSLSAQFEQTIVVTESGYESLTPFPL